MHDVLNSTLNYYSNRLRLTLATI